MSAFTSAISPDRPTSAIYDFYRTGVFPMQSKKAEIKSKDMEWLHEYINFLRDNPRLTYLFVELTDCCNLSCIHCGSSCGQSNGTYIDTDLLLNALESVAADFDPNSVMICLTGGEPMLHKDFYKIVQRVVELKFPWGFTTNGTLINSQTAEMLKQLRLQSVTISLDGLEASHEMLRNVSGCFRKTIEGVAALRAANIPVQITSVIHKGNFHELNDLYDLMCELQIYSWRVINMDPIGRALQHSELLLSCAEIRQLLDFIREKRYSKDTPMEVKYGCSHYLSFDYEREVRENYFICGSGIYVGSILCNGDIYSCLDIERRSDLIQGNIAKDRFSTVWFEKFKEFRTDRTQYSKECSECGERRFCHGDSAHTWDFTESKPMFCIRKGEGL